MVQGSRFLRPLAFAEQPAVESTWLPQLQEMHKGTWSESYVISACIFGCSQSICTVSFTDSSHSSACPAALRISAFPNSSSDTYFKALLSFSIAVSATCRSA